MEWKTFDHNFCEGSIYDMPEYYNSISSLAIVIFGLIGILNSFDDFVIKLLYGILFTSGIGSIFYHWFGTIGWALFDEFPMILIVFITSMFINHLSNHTKLIYTTQNKINHIINYFKITFSSIIMILFLVSNTMSLSRLNFPIYFGISVIYLVFQFISLTNQFSMAGCSQPNIAKRYPGKLKLNIKNQDIIPYVKTYLFYLIISAIFWISTECLCKYFKPTSESNLIVLYLVGHPMWHILVSYSFYNLLQIILYIKLIVSGFNVKINQKYMNLIVESDIISVQKIQTN